MGRLVGEPPYGGGRSSLGLDQSDLPYISYYDAANGDLKFAHLSGTVWIIQTVDSGGDVGQYSSLALDPAGCPHISYYDATNQDLRYAYVPPLADVAIVKSSQPPSTLRAGDRLTYTLAYSNSGLASATGVLITDVLPSTLTSVGYTYTGPAIAPTGSISYTWQAEDLPPCAGGVITLTGIVNPSASGVFSLTNRATITITGAGHADENRGNNVSVVHNTVDAEPPEIVATAPASGAMNTQVAAPVVITFSEPIDASTFAYTVAPDPGGRGETWADGGRVVTLIHDPFAGLTTHTVTIVAADDRAGNPLSGAPYAWHFATAPHRVVYLPFVMRDYP